MSQLQSSGYGGSAAEVLQRLQGVRPGARALLVFRVRRDPDAAPGDNGLFCRGICEGTDVGKGDSQDRGDRSCIPTEGTASVVRAALQHGLLSQGAQKLWYAGQMFRHERPKAGRQRRFIDRVERLVRSGPAAMLR